MRFNIKTRRETEGEKCPRCLESGREFMVVPIEGVDFFCCFKCGTLFLPKYIRVEELDKRRAGIQKAKEVPEVKEDKFVCDVCGKVCASKLGLMSHKRSCDKKK